MFSTVACIYAECVVCMYTCVIYIGYCKAGRRQSPIVLDTRAARKSSGLLQPGDTALTLNYLTAPADTLRVINTGHFLKVILFYLCDHTC